jgi:hypothetical protein
MNLSFDSLGARESLTISAPVKIKDSAAFRASSNPSLDVGSAMNASSDTVVKSIVGCRVVATDTIPFYPFLAAHDFYLMYHAVPGVQLSDYFPTVFSLVKYESTVVLQTVSIDLLITSIHHVKLIR